jgi:quinol monooxygenase YgiN
MNVCKNELKRSKGTPGQDLFGLVRIFFSAAILAMLLTTLNVSYAREPGMIVRISEIQIATNHLQQYKTILAEEAEASLRLEPGVIAIFPMCEKESDTEFRILEIYANREAYEAHLKTSHFQQYKSTTLHMVKSLKLVDMQAIDPSTMASMFKKMNALVK